jgi:4-hydroxyphenylacetate 3-monooxygenase
VLNGDPFHVSANTDPKGDRSKPPQEQDPDMLLHVVKETDAGIVVRGAKYETAAAVCQSGLHQADHRQLGQCQALVGLRGRVRLRPGLARAQIHLPHRIRRGAPAEDYPLANRFDEVDALVIFDDVLIPWENVLFYRHTKAAMFIRATLAPLFGVCLRAAESEAGRHDDRRGAVQCRQTGLDKQQAVQEKLAELAVYREGINAHLTASIALAEKQSGGIC